jgi:hypothetical protein
MPRGLLLFFTAVPAWRKLSPYDGRARDSAFSKSARPTPNRYDSNAGVLLAVATAARPTAGI